MSATDVSFLLLLTLLLLFLHSRYGANGVIDEVGEPPHRITVRAFRGGVGDLSDGIEFACADRDTKQDWVQLLLHQAWSGDNSCYPRVTRAPDDEGTLQRGAAVVRLLRHGGGDEAVIKLACQHRATLRACLSAAEQRSVDDALRAVATGLQEGSAARQCAAACALLLLGADPNEAYGREAALFDAASEANLQLCRVLLWAGADTNARNAEGETALSCCEAHKNSGWKEAVKLLRVHGAR